MKERPFTPNDWHRLGGQPIIRKEGQRTIVRHTFDNGEIKDIQFRESLEDMPLVRIWMEDDAYIEIQPVLVRDFYYAPSQLNKNSYRSSSRQYVGSDAGYER